MMLGEILSRDCLVFAYMSDFEDFLIRFTDA